MIVLRGIFYEFQVTETLTARLMNTEDVLIRKRLMIY